MIARGRVKGSGVGRRRMRWLRGSVGIGSPLLLHSITGAVAGYLLLHPATMLIYQVVSGASRPRGPAGWLAIVRSVLFSFDRAMLGMGAWFLVLGGLVGLGSGLYYRSLVRMNVLLRRQERELGRNVLDLIDRGEGERLEFKSTLRRDLRSGAVNRDLERVVVKTLAGFMNGEGGTLLIGVGDGGELVGLEEDYATLRRKDRDGFERCLVQLIVNHLGTDLVSLVHTIFHRVDGKEVARVYVEPSPRAVYMQSGEQVRYYLRTGNATRELNVEETMHHLLERRAGLSRIL